MFDPLGGHRVEVPKEHGNCPHCGADLNGGGIWEHFYLQFTEGAGFWLDEEGNYTDERRLLAQQTAAEAANKVAASYGASRTKGRWGKAIGIYDMKKDRTVAWRCPDCKGEWDRT